MTPEQIRAIAMDVANVSGGEDDYATSGFVKDFATRFLAAITEKQEPVATVYKRGAERDWMSEGLGSLPDGKYSLFLHPPFEQERCAAHPEPAPSEFGIGQRDKDWTAVKESDITNTCGWYEEYEGPWESTCGHAWVINEGTPAENDMNFCPFCGKPLIENKYVEDARDE